MTMPSLDQPDVETVRDYLLGLQARITAAVTAIDGSAFVVDAWQKVFSEVARSELRDDIVHL